MPSNFRAFHSDVRMGNGGVRLERRLIVVIPRILFWWLGERGVWQRWPDVGSPERLITVNDPWAVDEYNKDRAHDLYLRYPLLRGWGVYGQSTFSPDQAREIGEALAEIIQDPDVPGAEGLAMASRFLLMAAAHDCFVEMSGD